MNRLESLKIFISVAETLHFRETAQHLAVSPQVITRTISELEKELGEVLFRRSTRQVKLTDFGKQFLPQAQQVLADTDALFTRAKHKIHDERMAGVVRIAVPDMALMREVLAELWDKLADFPDVMIDWRSDLGLVDVVDEQIDVGIRFGTPEDSRLIIKKVGTAEDCIVASPTLIEKVGKPKDWHSLQRHYPLSALINQNTGRAWNWYLSNQHQFAPTKPRFVSNSMEDELIGVLKGQAFGCLPRLMCQPYLLTGELVELFPKIKRKQWIAYVYRPGRTVTPPRIRFVFDMLAQIMERKLAI